MRCLLSLVSALVRRTERTVLQKLHCIREQNAPPRFWGNFLAEEGHEVQRRILQFPIQHALVEFGVSDREHQSADENSIGAGVSAKQLKRGRNLDREINESLWA
jgi:hypothetical protein